jgi:hypothetical protein
MRVILGVTGLEHPPESPGKTAFSESRDAESDAPRAPEPVADDLPATTGDPDLRRVVEAWPTLSEAIRRAVMALIGTGGRDKT